MQKYNTQPRISAPLTAAWIVRKYQTSFVSISRVLGPGESIFQVARIFVFVILKVGGHLKLAQLEQAAYTT